MKSVITYGIGDRAKQQLALRLRKPTIAISVALLCLSAVAAVAQESASVVLPAVQVNRDIVPNRSHYGQQLLVDPKDSKTLVIVDNDLASSAGACPVYVSRDGGRSWATRTPQPKAPGYGSCTRPTFGPSMDADFGSDGTLYVLAAGSETASGRGTTDVYMARSTDLGETWQFTTIVKGTDEIDFTKPDGSKAKDTVRYNRLRMAVHPTDPKRVYAGIMSSPANLSTNEHPLRANVAVSTDGGRSFAPPVDIFASAPPDQIFGADVPALAVDRDGAIYAFTKERPPAPPAAPTPPPTPTPPDTPTATTTTTVAPASGAGCPPQPARTGPLPPLPRSVLRTPHRFSARREQEIASSLPSRPTGGKLGRECPSTTKSQSVGSASRRPRPPSTPTTAMSTSSSRPASVRRRRLVRTATSTSWPPATAVTPSARSHN